MPPTKETAEKPVTERAPASKPDPILSESAKAVAAEEHKKRETKQARSVEVMAQTAYGAIQQYEEAVGGESMDPWGAVPQDEKDFWMVAVLWVIDQRHLKPNPADLQDAHPVAGCPEPYKHLPLEKRLRCNLLVAIVRTFIECEA